MKYNLIFLSLLLATNALASYSVSPSYAYSDKHVEIRITIKNPTKSKLTEEWSFELPQPLRASDIISLNGVELEVDPVTKRLMVYGTETLKPNSNSVKKIKVKNVWAAEERIREIKKSTNELLNLIDSIPQDSSYHSKALELKEIAKQNLAKVKKDLETDSADKLIKNWANSEAMLKDLTDAKHELELLLQGKLERSKGLSSSMVVFVFGAISIMIALGLMWYAKRKQKVEYVESPMIRPRLPASRPVTFPRIITPRERPSPKRVSRMYPSRIQYPSRREFRYPDYSERYQESPSRTYELVRRRERYPRWYPKKEYPRMKYLPKKYEGHYPKKEYGYSGNRRLGRALVREFMREMKEELRKELVNRRGDELARAIKRELIRELKEEFRRELSYG